MCVTGTLFIVYYIRLCQETNEFNRLKGAFLKTLGERLKFIQKKSGKTLPEFAQGLRVSRDSLINYQQNRTSPDSRFLSTLCALYRVNPTWLLQGEGEPFVEGSTQEGEATKRGKAVTLDPVVQLLYAEEKRAGITLTPEQRTAILKILRELVERDVRSIRELLGSIQREKKKGDEL
jgi:transcriptional regulator with XRE-family HTH domain